MKDRIAEKDYKFKGDVDPLDLWVKDIDEPWQLENEINRIIHERRAAVPKYPAGQYLDTGGAYTLFIVAAKNMRRHIQKLKGSSQRSINNSSQKWLGYITSTINPHVAVKEGKRIKGDPMSAKTKPINSPAELKKILGELIAQRRQTEKDYPSGEYLDLIGAFEMFVLGAKTARINLTVSSITGKPKKATGRHAYDSMQVWLREVTAAISPYVHPPGET